MPGRGRPPKTRSVYSFEAAPLLLPVGIYLDTSFVVHALVGTQPAHAACQAFLQQLAEQESVIFFNRLLEVELAEAAFQLALKERFGRKRWKAARDDGRARRRAGRLLAEVREAWLQTLEAFSFGRIELHDVERAVPDLMRRYGLASYDAVHAASCFFASVDAIATVDTHFANVPASMLTIYTNQGRVAACRKRRPR